MRATAAAVTTMPPAGPGIQSSKPEKPDASLANIKGHDYYKDTFVPPSEVVTEIDARDKVRSAVSPRLR